MRPRPERRVVEITPPKIAVKAVLRLPSLGMKQVRDHGNIIDEERQRRHDLTAITHENDQLSTAPIEIVLDKPARGDDCNQGLRACRIFTNDTHADYVTGSTIVIPGLPWKSLKELQRGTFQPDTCSPLVRALTVDGKGGQWRESGGQITACVMFYMEQIFRGTPFEMFLDMNELAIKDIDKESERQPATLKNPTIRLRLAADLAFWHANYLAAIDNSPTGMPITEHYFRQFEQQNFFPQSKERTGNNLFGQIVWRILRRKRNQILAAAKQPA